MSSRNPADMIMAWWDAHVVNDPPPAAPLTAEAADPMRHADPVAAFGATFASGEPHEIGSAAVQLASTFAQDGDLVNARTLYEYAIDHGDPSAAARARAELLRLTERAL